MHHGTSTIVKELLSGLNDPQREAVAHTDGPLLILAGPGSGKTRVVTRRATYLAATVTQPRHILALTFTNKAASEMRERIASLGLADGMTVCTFHALCAKLLRWHHDRAGIPKNFTIFDRDDRRKLIKKAIEQCDLSSSNWTPAGIDQDISRAKNALRSPAEFADIAYDFRSKTVARIYAAYEKLLSGMGGLDFDDLLMRVAILVETDNDLRDELEDRFQYVLIDEYQDTNAAQYQIVRRLTLKRTNLCATGDPDQSIYGWRGADIENILRFERDYPGAKVVRLEQNYRSSKRILAVAGTLIAGNMTRKIKALWTDNAEGTKVRVQESETGDEEAALIARDITRRLKAGADEGDVAIFYRVNSLSRVMEEALIREGVRYQIARGLEFYGRKEIKDVLAYLRVLLNPADDIALLRIINTPPRGIGATTIQRLVELAATAGCPISGLITSDADLSTLGRSAAKVGQFGELLDSLAPAIELPAPQALETVVSRSGLRALYSGEADREDAPINNINELVSAASAYHVDFPEATVLEWLEHTALLGDVDAVDSDAGSVTLMTLHAAKGLEYPIVYVLGLEEGLLPFRRGGEGDGDDEEERRLLFVGITRAREHLTLSRARYRMMRGTTQRTILSPFLDELPRDQLEWLDEEPRLIKGRADASSASLPDDIEEWGAGTLVRHPAHGLGQIISMHRGARRTHVDVQFRGGLRRSWVLEFAQLQRVDFDEVGDPGEAVGA